MKRLFSSALCAAALLVLAACGGEQPGPAPSSAVAALPTSVPVQETPAPLPTPTPVQETPAPLPTPTPVQETPAPLPTPTSTPVVLPLATPSATPAPDDGWLSYTAATEVGDGKRAALSTARVSEGELSLCFVPVPTQEDIQSFQESPTVPPRVSVSYNEDFGVLFVKLSRTLLASGEPQSGEEDWVYDYVRDQGLNYPYYISVGALGEDNRFFTKSAISTDGTDVTITLMLTDAAKEYRVETSHLAEEMYPTVRILFRESP